MLRVLAFHWRPNDTASRGTGEEKNQSATKFRKNAPQVRNFLNSFVQDCSFLIQHGWPYDALSLVYLYFVVATCCRRCTQGPTTLLSLILSPRLVARIQTGLNSCDWSRRQNFAAAKMTFIKLTVSHKANCCGDLSPRRVCFEVLSCFFYHPSIDSNKKMSLSPFKGGVEVSSLFLLRGVWTFQ